ncbi:MAG: ornithine carbamoyltransferase [Candidatus Aenigmarchaeota archaeon]
MTKHFLTLFDFSEKEVKHILDLALKVKSGEVEENLEGQTLAMLLEKPPTWAEVSFEVGIRQLGGHVTYLDMKNQLDRGVTIEDITKILSRYCNAIMTRVNKHADLEKMASVSKIPIINALSEKFHPCQTMADMLTVLEKKGKLEDLKVVFMGDCGFNMFHSTMIGFSKMWSNVVAVCPDKKEYMPDPEIVEKARKYGKGIIKIEHDPVKGIRDADVVITDKWVSPEQEKEEKRRVRDFKKYQVNSELVKHAKQDFIFMHCLPALRGYEVTNDIIDGQHSVVFDEAENRLHAQNAIMLYLLKGV